MNREFLQLAHTFCDNYIIGWYMSEKLDGMRCFWDGGISRGMAASDVPYANTEKHHRLVDKVYATGLWSRYGQVIRAPDWFIDNLPQGLLLDGELFAGRNNFQEVMRTVKHFVPDDKAWRGINYCVFDSPPPEIIFESGRINNNNFKKLIDVPRSFWYKKVNAYYLPFGKTYSLLLNELKVNANLVLHPQEAIINMEQVETKMIKVSELKGEGLMFRDRESFWRPKRVHTLLKHKKLLSGEATVVGYISGRRTELGSKLLGKMGALIVQWNNLIFELSGFTDEERMFSSDATSYAESHPGERVPFSMNKFPVGGKVKFLYRDTTEDGLPKEARYMREG